jgi:hypothetical protein
MKITKRQLRRIIKEEKQKLVKEQGRGSSGDGGAAARAISKSEIRSSLRPVDADENADAQAEGFQALGTVGSDYYMGYGILVMTDGSNYYLMYRGSDWQDWGPLSLQKMVDELLYEEEEGNLD